MDLSWGAHSSHKRGEGRRSRRSKHRGGDDVVGEQHDVSMTGFLSGLRKTLLNPDGGGGAAAAAAAEAELASLPQDQREYREAEEYYLPQSRQALHDHWKQQL